MSNYTKPTIGNDYNANPPPDDGSTDSSNEITWSKHVNKLAGPLKTFIDAINTAIQTSFGKVFGGSNSAKTANYTVTTSDEGRIISCTNSITITLPAVSSAGSGFVVALINSGTGTITIDGDSSETINGSTTQTLSPGDGAILQTNGSTWFAFITSTGKNVFVTEGDYPLISTTPVQPHNLSTSGTYESYGATGSGATNIWTALDNIPDDADWIEVRAILIDGSTGLTANTVYTADIRVRNSGGSADSVAANSICYDGDYTDSSGRLYLLCTGVGKIPVTGTVFEAAWNTGSGNAPDNSYLYLVGYGYN